MKKILKSKIENQEKMNLAELKLRENAEVELKQLYELLDSTDDGLSDIQAEEKLEEFGPNAILIDRTNTIFNRLKEAIINPFNIILIIIATISFFTDFVLDDNGSFLTSAIIITLVLLSSMIAFIQGEKSNKVANQLYKMIANKAHIKRGNRPFEEIDIEEIVVGDLIKLSAGDMIPADVRFILTKDTFIAQAALTGESNPVEKFCDHEPDKTKALTEIENLGFMGTNIISGSATAIVLATGNETYFGAMAKSLSGDRAKNSFEKGVDSVSSLLIKFMIIMVPVIIVINGITKGDWISSILFAITIAVGLTPEMLPVIMTSTLAKGAVSMAKHKVIVKNLSSIQVFGEMDILCTDKTGTLTEDKIILEKYMDPAGNDDGRVLRHAYLNSYFQTGLKNLIDVAIINRAKENHLEEVLDKYELVDEIPFDFIRRRMSVVIKDKNGKTQLITKGAVEEMLERCSFVEVDGAVVALDDDAKNKALEVYKKHNTDGLRMIAVAQKNEIPDVYTFNVEHENQMVLIGFVGFLDPPKESAKTAIQALKDHGVKTVVLTGDSEGVALKVCNKVGIDTSRCLTGTDVENMNSDQLQEAVKTCCLFSKLSPSQKERVVDAFQKNGHTVGYMGDGINDALPLKQSDVGISVDNAVDIAKETADIILLKKDLMVLEEGVIEGRKTFGNIMKYLKMATSGNFGNMFSVVIASLFLPFLPMIPAQILTQNLLTDFSQMGIAFDDVDKEYLEKPKKWDVKSMTKFMFFLGPLSSVFDVATFIVLFYVFKANTIELAPLFQCGWFIFGTVSQIMVIYMIRTSKQPWKSKVSTPLIVSTLSVIIITLIIGFTSISSFIGANTVPLSFFPWLVLILLGYAICAQIIKIIYIKKYQEWF